MLCANVRHGGGGWHSASEGLAIQPPASAIHFSGGSGLPPAAGSSAIPANPDSDISMSIRASVLQTLHRIQRQKSDISGQLERAPKTIQAAQQKIAFAEQALQEIRDQQKKLRMDADRKQLQLREREQRISVLEGKMNAAKENREYQTLKEQIAADRQANNVLSDEILEILEEIDRVHATIAPAEERVKLAQQDARKVEQLQSGRIQVLESELERVLRDLTVAEADLPADFKSEYSRLVAMRGEDSMAEVEGNCCGGCYQTLTSNVLERLSQGYSTLCPSCGRYIYRD
jgi:uncharacterized protein